MTWKCSPATSPTPASPASAPEIAAASSSTRPGAMPACAAARGLTPTARIWKPSVVQRIRSHTAMAASAAISTPRCSRVVPSSIGYSASMRMSGESG